MVGAGLTGPLRHHFACRNSSALSNCHLPALLGSDEICVSLPLWNSVGPCLREVKISCQTSRQLQQVPLAGEEGLRMAGHLIHTTIRDLEMSVVVS